MSAAKTAEPILFCPFLPSRLSSPPSFLAPCSRPTKNPFGGRVEVVTLGALTLEFATVGGQAVPSRNAQKNALADVPPVRSPPCLVACRQFGLS